MIAPHRPPFGIARALTAAIPWPRGGDVSGIEKAYVEWARAEAVWLPSARAGILWGLEAALDAQACVLAPVFTCNALHQELMKWPGTLSLVDAGDDFLMDLQRQEFPQKPGWGVVLCEAYGHLYDLEQLERKWTVSPTIRIVDMAMSVPHPQLVERLKSNDLAVISFGIGKSMYAGWGGMAFTRNQSLASEIRRMRDLVRKEPGPKQKIQRAGVIAFRTLSHYPFLYRISRELALRRGRANTQCPAPTAGESAAGGKLSALWTQSCSSTDCALAISNLKGCGRFDEKRRSLAQRYRANLSCIPQVSLPPDAGRALSHFTIRLSATIRDSVKQRLYQEGINATTLWEFPYHLDAHRFPRAHRLSSEVLNLPLSAQLDVSCVDAICEKLALCVDAQTRKMV